MGGGIILKCTLKKRIGKACTDLPQKNDNWWAFVKAAIKSRFAQMRKIT